MKKCFLLFIFVTLLFSRVAFSQEQTIIGLNITGETTIESFEMGAGFSFEHIFTKHSGIETGLFYHGYSTEETYVSGSITDKYTIKENYLYVPLLYKFYSSIVNFSGGPEFEYYMGYSQKNTNPGSLLHPYQKGGKKLGIGLMVKLGKSIHLSKRVLLEPALRFIFNSHIRGYFGLGLGAKYELP